MTAIRVLLVLLLGGIVYFATPPSADAQKRAITKVAGNIYRFQNNAHFSVFAVTPEGVIATDPINADAARWLLAEIKRRYNRPVRYVILSHDHPDHSSGAKVFKKAGALIVAHARARDVIIGEKRPTAVPDITFRRRMNLHLGGTKVELHYVGKNHSDNMIVVLFPAERILFAVDFIPVRTLPYRDLPDAYMPDWIDSLHRVERMDFDTLVPGHGPIGKKADAAAFRRYLTDLYNAVITGARQGKDLKQLKATITLEKYKDWGRYNEWRALNIEGMYRLVQANRVEN